MTKTSHHTGPSEHTKGDHFPPPPFDPELAPILAEASQWISPSMTYEQIHENRAASDNWAPRLDHETLSRGGAFAVEERLVPGPEGAPEVALLICTPVGVSAPTPAIYFTHGGGMTSGHNTAGIGQPLDWAEEVGCAVVSVEYRLAPEHRHPAAIEDCYAGLRWTSDNASDLNIDPSKIVVAGASAGGGLTAALALLARDRGEPGLAGQMLLCPMLDDRNDSPSGRQMAGVGIWDRTSNETGWTALLGASRGGPEVSPYASPARADDLSGLPPTFIDVGSAETFRDEDVAYASRIWAAGGEAELHVWPGGFHGYTVVAPHARLSQDTVKAQVQWLRRLLL